MTTSTATHIAALMEESGVKFGTSGARGLVSQMTDEVCFAYTVGFIQHLENTGSLHSGETVAIAGDLRPSTPRILRAVAKAIETRGYKVDYGGLIPAPAIAYYGLQRQMPCVMVTGSHIPADRNGIKYNTKQGEFLKKDEAGLKKQTVHYDSGLFDDSGRLREDTSVSLECPLLEPENLYRERYLKAFGSEFLQGLKIGFYQHSAVGRDLLPEILESLGAEVMRFGRSESFVPVDTEAIRPEDVALAKDWVKTHPVYALFSTDGDSDRPLIGDADGRWLRGDIAGILTSLYFKADAVSTPVSCNTALEETGKFPRVVRTRIGSPYVIEGMMEAVKNGAQRVVGYEANGGYFHLSPLEGPQGPLNPLPTRDTLAVILGILGLGQKQNERDQNARGRHTSVAELVSGLPPRFTISNRLKEFPTEASQKIIRELLEGPEENIKKNIEEQFGGVAGRMSSLDTTDGLRITFHNHEVIHLRPSGNAPEFRCYNEADSEERADALNAACLKIMESWRP